MSSFTPKQFHESLNAMDLQSAHAVSEESNSSTVDDEEDSKCFKAGIGYQSFTSFEEQMRLARKREELRRKKEMEDKLGGSRTSIKDRLKMFEKNSASAST
jgi:hypothetical protein